MEQARRFHGLTWRLTAVLTLSAMLIGLAGAALADYPVYSYENLLSFTGLDSLYAPYGLVRNQENGRLYYQGKLVRTFDEYDVHAGEDYLDRSGGEVDLYRAHDSNGNFKGIGVYTQAEFEQRTEQWLLLIVARELRGSTSSAGDSSWPSTLQDSIRWWYGSDAWQDGWSEWAEFEEEAPVIPGIILPETTKPPLVEDPEVKQARAALDNYFILWQGKAFDQMMLLTPSDWQESVFSPQVALEAMYGDLELISWSIADIPLLKEKSLICFEADIEFISEGVLEEEVFSVILRNDGKIQWHVEPETLHPDFPVSMPVATAAPVQEAPTPEQPPEEAYVALTDYMACWEAQNYEDMVAYTLPSWRETQSVPQRQLAWNHSGWLIKEWAITNSTVVDTDSISIAIVVDSVKNTSSQTPSIREYAVQMFRVDGQWYVDPDSLRNGVVLVAFPEANDRR